MADQPPRLATRLEEYVPGNVDKNGEVIEKVLSRGKACVIYETPVALRVEIDSDASQTNFNYVQILPLLTRVRNLQAGRFASSDSLKAEIARAVLVALNGKLEDAKQMFTAQRRRLVALHNLHGRLEYLGAGVAVALLLGIVVTVAWLFHVPAPPTPTGPEAGALLLLKVAWAGTLGGVMSVYLGIRKIDIETESTWILHAIVGASRIVFALCAAILAYFAVGAVSQFLGLNPAGNEAALFTLGIAAGFSETWVPNLMRALQHRAAPEREPAAPGEEAGREKVSTRTPREIDYSTTHAADGELLPPSAPGM